jgi:transposase
VNESYFTSLTAQPGAYSLPNAPLIEPLADAMTTRVALVAAISADRGLEGFFTTTGSMDGPAFCQILPHIDHHGPGAVVLMDNVAYHKSGYMKDQLKEFGIQAVFNVAYSPNLNGIERYFSIVKRNYKAIKLNSI